MSLGDFAGADAREWMDRPEWMRSERIRGFASHPLMFRGRLLGVLAVFARVPIDEARFSSLRLFAERAAAGIANAQARGNITELGR